MLLFQLKFLVAKLASFCHSEFAGLFNPTAFENMKSCSLCQVSGRRLQDPPLPVKMEALPNVAEMGKGKV